MNAMLVRIMLRLVLASLLLALSIVLISRPLVAGSDKNIGFEDVRIPDSPEQPLVAGIWYPTTAPASTHVLGPFTQTVALDAPVSGSALPLVVISHGGGGSLASHYDTALALAAAGFVVAAVNHAGDTDGDESRVLELWRRPAQLRRLISYVLDEWPEHQRLDARRVGAFGFSNGGFTVLVAAGGVPDLDRIGPYCDAHPDHDLCETLKHADVDPHHLPAVPDRAWIADPRIQAAVIAAPAFGFTFGRAGLKRVQIPIELWRADNDRHQPGRWYDEAVRDALPHPPEYHVIPDAGHYDFLAPCSARLRAANPQICANPRTFDRAAFHRTFNEQVVRFFRTHLTRQR